MTAEPATPADVAGRATVIDGDTRVVAGETVRLWGVEAPERAQTFSLVGEPVRAGRIAAAALAGWIGEEVVVRARPPRGPERDRSGRTLGRCAVGGADLAGRLVQAGLARDWPDDSGGFDQPEESAARHAQRGFWRGDGAAPWQWRRR